MSQTIFAIIDEFKDKTVFDKLKINTIALSSSIFDDITIDEFLVEKIQTINPSILIIPASLGSIQTNYWGLRIGMHIRLSSFLEKIRLIPIIFISDNSLEEILRFQEEKFGIQAVLEGS